MDALKQLYSLGRELRPSPRGVALALLLACAASVATALCAGALVDAFLADERADFLTRLSRVGPLLAVTVVLALVYHLSQYVARRLAGAYHRLFLGVLKSLALAAGGGDGPGDATDSTRRTVDEAAAVAPDRLVVAGRDGLATVVMVVLMATTSILLAAAALGAAAVWNIVGAWRVRRLSVSGLSERDRASAQADLTAGLCLVLSMLACAVATAALLVEERLTPGEAACVLLLGAYVASFLYGCWTFVRRYRSAMGAAERLVTLLSELSPRSTHDSTQEPATAEAQERGRETPQQTSQDTAPPADLPPAGAAAPETAGGRNVLRGSVSLENVAARDAASVVEGLTLSLEPGSIVAICDPEGSGSQTLLNLLMGVTRPSAGRILVQEIPAEPLGVEALRQQIAVVDGEDVIATGTIEEIIKAGRPGASHQEIVAAAQSTGVTSFLPYMPDGLSSAVDDPSAILSVGQKLRIVLARALLAGPAVLVLHHALAGVDRDSREFMLDALKVGRDARSTLILTRDPGLPGPVDRLYVLQNGTLVDQERP